ncbi:MAG: flagellar basal body P-ring protein FlgI [Planctomycetes bacterium]|nr:flagellar basal body P-ring protein FlgI [Planctomycetota bacterium]
MSNAKTAFLLIIVSAILARSAGNACAATVQDLVRIKGHEQNVLIGMGIVIGLNGTGDSSKDSLLTARPYAQLFKNLGNMPVSVDELADADSYALVQVTMRIPAMGVREGDRLDVSLNTLFNAEDLTGGRLVVSLLRLPGPDTGDSLIFAFAEGPLIIESDNLRSALVRDGGQMLKDIRVDPVGPNGVIELVLNAEYAGFPVATTIADAINDEFLIDGYSDIAMVMDAKNIRVLMPNADRAYPAQFIATLLMIPIESSLIQTRARIVINERQGIIAVTGMVEIGPVAVTHRGLTITSVTPKPESTLENPVLKTSRWAGLDTTDKQTRSSTRLVDLLDALDRLNVPVQDQIAIIYELKRTGVLHAEIIHE